MTALLALSLRSESILRIDPSSGEVTVLLARTGPAPDGIVVHDDHVYWTTMGAPVVTGPGERGRDYSPRNGGVHGAALDGTGAADVVPAGGLTTGKQLACDEKGTLYWSDREGHRVSRVPSAGGDPEDLIVNHTGEPALDECVGVAVDPAAGHLYWTQKGPSKGGRGRILRAGLAVPSGQTPQARSDVEVLWDGLPEPIDLEIVGDRLYWTDRGADDAGGNSLNRAPIPGPGEHGGAPEILATGFAEAIGLAVDADAGVAYVSALGGDVVAVPLEPGAGAPRVVVSLGEPLSGLALLR
ncbi:MAG: hypothetical protein QM809_00155 [Gordonia sp. (in: high G+C Gram-positive bacteria)]|uniref:hypothetical protein n=1 Tax=Gordonia sp. (in: high G+C Gram-positive bacteria) TaxID=84139 RepID=UPI0039E3D3BF